MSAAIETHGLVKTFGATRAVNGIDLAIVRVLGHDVPREAASLWERRWESKRDARDHWRRRQ